MAKKIVYPPVKEGIRLGRGQPPSGSSTYSHQPAYLVSMKLGQSAPPVPLELVKQVRRRAKRPLKPVSRRTLALVNRALQKLRRG